MTFQGRFRRFSGEVQNDLGGGAYLPTPTPPNPAMYSHIHLCNRNGNRNTGQVYPLLDL